MGTPDFAVPSLEHLVINKYSVVAVYTRPDRPAGRGRSVASSPVKEKAMALKLPVIQPPRLDPEAVADLKAFRPEAIVVAAFGQVLPPSVLGIPRYGGINIHPSLLPRFRGASPVAAAILAGDEFTGVSIMLMDEGLDTGPLLARAQIPVSPADTTGSLTAKLSVVGAGLLQEVLWRWPRGEVKPLPQDEARASYCKPISRDDGDIDWGLPAVDIWRRVRAFQPWPGGYTRWRGKQLKIIEALPLPGEAALEIGRVVALPSAPAAFGVQTADGVLGVLQVQLEGKRVTGAGEFLNGQRQFVGATLPSRGG